MSSGPLLLKESTLIFPIIRREGGRANVNNILVPKFGRPCDHEVYTILWHGSIVCLDTLHAAFNSLFFRAKTTRHKSQFLLAYVTTVR